MKTLTRELCQAPAFRQQHSRPPKADKSPDGELIVSPPSLSQGRIPRIISSCLVPGLSREGSGIAEMVKGSAFLIRSAVQVLALLILTAVGWAAPQQAFAATEHLNANLSLEAGSRQHRSPNSQSLDPPCANRCALTRKYSDIRAAARDQNGAANGDGDAPSDAQAILTAACISYGESGQEWQPCPTDRGIVIGHSAAFQSRAPPFLTHC